MGPLRWFHPAERNLIPALYRLCVCVCMYVCMCVCMYVCVYVCITSMALSLHLNIRKNQLISLNIVHLARVLSIAKYQRISLARMRYSLCLLSHL